MKPGECVIAGSKGLVDMLIACVPMEWTSERTTAALASMLHRAVGFHLTYGQCWALIWPESDAEWEAVADAWLEFQGMVEGVSRLPVPEPPDEHPTAEAFKLPAVRQHYTDNRFQVSSCGFRVVIHKPPDGWMSAADAVNLAAWLVAQADPTRELFDAVLDAALNT